jgi:hypothetical protein
VSKDIAVPAGLSRVDEIIWLERLGDRAQELAAERIAAELESGKSQRQLAREIGKSQTHVCHMAKAWELYRGESLGNHPSFNEAYHSREVRGTGRGKPRGVASGPKVVQGSAEPVEHLASPPAPDPAPAARTSVMDTATAHTEHQTPPRPTPGTRPDPCPGCAECDARIAAMAKRLEEFADAGRAWKRRALTAEAELRRLRYARDPELEAAFDG